MARLDADIGLAASANDDLRLPAGTGTLGKAMAVVEAIAAAERPLRFRDLAARIDQPKATLHRQIANLIEEGLVELRGDQTYGLGLRLLKLAARSWGTSQFRLIAEPHLRRLHALTGETVHLGVLRGVEVIYVDKVESQQAVRMHSQIGNASPVYCTGVGKAALSTLADGDVHALMQKISFVRHTPHTLTDADALTRELADIRREGVSYDREEHEPGIHCVAAPIHSVDRRLAAGISVTAPVYRISRAQLEDWREAVVGAADAIMEDMEMRMGPRS